MHCLNLLCSSVLLSALPFLIRPPSPALAGFLLNNWVELRGDVFKLCEECQRPPPIRSDSIGHSVAVLEFLTWLGSLSTAALVHLYRGPEPVSHVRLSRLLLSVFIAQQVYLAFQVTVRYIFAEIGSQSVRDAEAKRFVMRKTYLETFSEEKAGTSRRERARTYAGTRPQIQVTPPSTDSVTRIGQNEQDERDSDASGMSDSQREMQIEGEYRSELEERFWSEKESQEDTTEAGKKLIVALKDLHEHVTAATDPELDKSKRP